MMNIQNILFTMKNAQDLTNQPIGRAQGDNQVHIGNMIFNYADIGTRMRLYTDFDLLGTTGTNYSQFAIITKEQGRRLDAMAQRHIKAQPNSEYPKYEINICAMMADGENSSASWDEKNPADIACYTVFILVNLTNNQIETILEQEFNDPKLADRYAKELKRIFTNAHLDSYSMPPEPQKIEHSVSIMWGELPEVGQKPCVYAFDTLAEKKAFLMGIEQSNGWRAYKIID